MCWGSEKEAGARHRNVQPDEFQASQSPLSIRYANHFLLEGSSPHYEMRFDLPEEGASAYFTIQAGWPLWMARAGRALHYLGYHSGMEVMLKKEGDEIPLKGTGTFEHVCGVSLPFDFRNLLGVHWHWDVLAFHTPGSPSDSAMGLSIGRGGKTIWRKQAEARIPGFGTAKMKGLDVHYLKMETAHDPMGREVSVPLSWEGSMKGRQGTLNYIAKRATPMMPMVQGGGFLGFDFDASWTPKEGDPQSLTGTGFSEYGDFSGSLRKASS